MCLTVKFVVWCCGFCKLRSDFGFLCSVNHLSGGGINANHNETRSPSLAGKNHTENVFRLLRNSEESSLFQAFRLLGTAQRDVSRKKKIKRGWGRGESEGTPVRLLN